MVLVGAITRLSESGLSIAEWNPIMGALPPLHESEWQRVYALYKESPEFEKRNFWMNVEDFKTIFFWEWFHRLLGRLIGVFYALPFAFFLIKKWIPKKKIFPLCGIFILGGLQGLMGWYMVQSGLVEEPSVSHYRLAAHLLLALMIYSMMFLYGLVFLQKSESGIDVPDKKFVLFGFVCLIFLIVTILWGAFTAGLDAGLVYNDSFPLMGGRFIPEEVWFYKPVWLNFLSNSAGVQFVHRWLALFTLSLILLFSFWGNLRHTNKKPFIFLGFMVIVQVVLGITTLLSAVAMPVAVMHQGGAVIVLSLVLLCLHDLMRPSLLLNR